MDGTSLTIFALAIFLLILSLTKLRLQIKIRRTGKNNYFSLELSIWKSFIFYKMEVPSVKISKEDIEDKGRVVKRPLFWPLLRPAFKIRTEVEGKGGRPIAEEMVRMRFPGISQIFGFLTTSICLMRKYKKAVIYLLGKMNLRHLKWKTEIGAEDPSQTGLLTGILWSLKSFAVTLLCSQMYPVNCRPVLSVSPSFEKACFNTQLVCVIEVRAGYIFIAGFRALALKLTGRACNYF